MTVLRMTDLDLSDKKVLIREDLNVPLSHREITNDTRIQKALPTIKLALEQGARVMIMSHLGRPAEGHFDKEYSLAPVATRLSELLGQEVPIVKDWLYGVDVEPGQAVLCENVRFNAGEKANIPELAEQMAKTCDVFVMDAFATAHRAEASTAGIPQFAPVACAGPLLVAELEALEQGLKNPKKPVVAIVGGSKVSTKLKVLKSLAQSVDSLIIGGGIANTFIAAQGYEVGKSLFEPELIEDAENLMSNDTTAHIPMPIDVVVAEKMSADSESYTKAVKHVDDFEKILDIGPKTAKQYAEILHKAGTILWNGPVGAFEIDQFGEGTKAIALAIANSKAFSIAGGGDTIAAIDKYNIADKVSYISTGGGAFLCFLEGKPLPAVVALETHTEKA